MHRISKQLSTTRNGGDKLEYPVLGLQEVNLLEQVIDNDGELSENNTNLNWDDDNDIFTVRGAIQIKDSNGDIAFYADNDEMYFTKTTAISIEAGMPIGLALALTYASP